MKVLNKYIIRIIIATLLYFIIKLYDQTFKGQFLIFSFRAIAVWLFMLAYVLTIWQISDWLYGRLMKGKLKDFSFKKRFRLLAIIYSFYGVFVAISFSISYTLFDLFLFDIQHYGSKYQFFDLDANIGMYLGYWSLLLFRGQFYLLQHAKDNELLSEKLKKESIQSQHQALKNQIDPHFFFNSMSVLTGLVYKNADLSADYITQLSKMYRYILDKKHGVLVKLKEELEFLESYIFLIKIRFEKSVILDVDFDILTKESILIPPNTLQILAENAIKHNKFSEEQPLKIELFQDGTCLVVQNNLSKREQLYESTAIGLENINKRYKLLCGSEIKVTETNSTFKVCLPQIKKIRNESIIN